MQANGKRVLCGILSVFLLIGLCACNKNNDNPNDVNPGEYDGELPESIFGTWYPHPEVSDSVIEIDRSGSCTVDGKTVNWSVDTVDGDSMILTAGGSGEYSLSFSQLSSGLPVLREGSVGTAVKEPEVWNYMIEWFCKETGNAFSMNLEDLAQCRIRFEEGKMVVEALEEESVTHTVVFTPSQATVAASDGRKTVYYPMAGGPGGNGDADSPEGKYTQARKDLQSVLSGGSMTDYVDSDGVRHLISGAKAMEKLYNTFVSLQNDMDVSEQLNCIRRVDNVLVRRNSIYSASNIITTEYSYDCYGGIERIYEAEAVSSGKYLCYGYQGEGNATALTVCGVVSGRPVFDAEGKLTALEVTSKTTGKTYTATVRCDADGRVVCVDVPFGEGRGEAEAQYGERYQFLYNADGRLMQYTNTRLGEFGWDVFYIPRGYYERSVTEYYYDATGKLTMSVIHKEYTDGMGIGWDRETTNYLYHASGNLSQTTSSSCGILNPTPDDDTAVRQAIFQSDGFVDSIGKDLFGKSNLEFDAPTQMPPDEYEYGSIYIYQPEE